MAADDPAPVLPPGLLAAAWFDRASRASDSEGSADALGVAVQLYERARADGSNAFVLDEATALAEVGRVQDALVLLAQTFDQSLAADPSTDREAGELAVRCARQAAWLSHDAGQFAASAQWAVRSSRAALERTGSIDPAFASELADSLDELAPDAAAVVREEVLRAMSDSPSACLPPVVVNGRLIEPGSSLDPADRRDLWFGLLQKDLADRCKDAGEPWEEHAVAAARSLDRRAAWELVPGIVIDVVRSCAELEAPVDWHRERTGEEPPARRIARELSAVGEAPEDEIERVVALARATVSWQELRAETPEAADSAWVIGLAGLADDDRLYEEERRQAEEALFAASRIVGRMAPEAHAVLADRLEGLEMDEPMAFAAGDEVIRHTVEVIASKAVGLGGLAADVAADVDVLVERLQAHADRCGPEVTRCVLDHFGIQDDAAGDASWCLARAVARMICVGRAATSGPAVARDRQEVVELLVAATARAEGWTSIGSAAALTLRQVVEARRDLPLDIPRVVDVVESTERLGAGVGLSIVDACDALEPLVAGLDELASVDALAAIRDTATDRFVEDRLQALEDADDEGADLARAAVLEAVRELTAVGNWATAASLARAAVEVASAPSAALGAEAPEPDEAIALRQVAALDVAAPEALAGAIVSGRPRPETVAIVARMLNASPDLVGMTEPYVPLLGAERTSMDELLAAILEEVDHDGQLEVPHLGARPTSGSHDMEVLDTGPEHLEGPEPGEREDPGGIDLPDGF